MKSWDDEILKALAHPTRRTIIEVLREKKTLSFNELLELVKIGNHGKLGFHQRALKGLIKHDSSKNEYRLTDRGQLAGEMSVFFDFAKNKELLKYEAAVGRQMHGEICGMCMYNTHKLDEKYITALMKCHGHLISRDIAWKMV